MLIPTTPARLASLVRSRILFILVSSSVAGLGALAIGLMTPYVYYSESLVQVESKPAAQDPLGTENTDLYKISLVANSAQVVNEVALELSKEPLDTGQAFPQSISILDIAKRMKLMSRHLKNAGDQPEGPAPLGGGAGADVLASLLQRHLRVDTDSSTRTVKVSYEAGDPNTAREICGRVTTHFLEATASIEQQELKRQEKYLEAAIQQQLDAIKIIEGKMREIVERYPQMSSGKEEQRGTAVMAARYLEKQEMLRKLDTEMDENDRLLGTISRDLASRKKNANDVDEDVTNRIKDEINQLDYKRLQYTRVSGYSEDNPEIVAIQKRIKSLKRILASGKRDYGEGENTKSLNDKLPELRAKHRRLLIEKENVSNQLKSETTTFKEVVKVNFTFDSLVRELNANAAITTELYRDLQKTRLNIAGSAARTVLLSPASLSVYASNVSVNKRTLFGFFVGMALGLSFLLLLDLIQPLLLLVDDLDLLKVGHFGVLRREKRCISQIAYCIMSLKSKESAPRSQTLAFFPVSLEFPYETYLFKVAQTLIDGKARVGILVVDDPDAKRRWKHDDECTATIETLARDEVPAKLATKTAEMRERFDWVFVLCPASADVPFAAFTAGAANHFFYVTQLGVSDLKSIQRMRAGVEKNAHLDHYALVFS